jgi:alkylation response protein AidB-like acyl-CoA dehydrogenase
MELRLETDQELLLETTQRFLGAEASIAEVRRLHDDPVGFDGETWKRGAELGWTSMLVAEELGGGSVSGNGLADLCLVSEEFGRQVAPGPLLPVNVVASALSRSGSEQQCDDVLPGLLSGEAIATWAFAEPNDRWDQTGVELTATSSGGDWVLEGTKAFVEGASVASHFLVTARTDDGLTQFLVPAGTEGITVEPLTSLDMTRRYANLVFDRAGVPASAVVGSIGGAGGAGGDVEHQLQVALVLQNAETVGATSRVFDMTLEYANDRMSFGRPIGSYQAIKHRLADMKMWLEACLGTSTASARAVQQGADNAAELVSVSKAYIAERCPLIVQDCIQLHGGIGVTWEHDIHLYLRRVAQNAAMYGSARRHRFRLADLTGVTS